MKKQIIAVHGGQAFSDYGKYLESLEKKNIDPGEKRLPSWRENLPTDLGEEYEVFLPSMPNSNNSRYAEWKIWFEKYLDFVEEEVVLVGHSLGAMFLAKYLSEEKIPCKVSSLHLVAGAYEKIEFDGEDGADFNVDIKKLRDISEVTKDIYIYHSKDDFVVPYSSALILKEIMSEATLISHSDQGHYLTEHFPALIKNIKS